MDENENDMLCTQSIQGRRDLVNSGMTRFGGGRQQSIGGDLYDGIGKQGRQP